MSKRAGQLRGGALNTSKERLMLNYPAAYQSTKGSALDVDQAFYRRIAEERNARELIESIVVPIRSGQAWTVPAGHVFRIVTIEGPQVADLNLWNLQNPRERMWASRTRQLQAAHVSTRSNRRRRTCARDTLPRGRLHRSGWRERTDPASATATGC
jgi:uncharacterized protein YcgI (DUF1989 family)